MNGFLYLAGSSAFNGWIVQKRSLDDGSIIWSKSTSFDGWSNLYSSVFHVSQSGVYFFGVEPETAGGNGYVEKRSPVDGSIVWRWEVSDSQLGSVMSINSTNGLLNFICSDFPILQLSESDASQTWESSDLVDAQHIVGPLGFSYELTPKSDGEQFLKRFENHIPQK